MISDAAQLRIARRCCAVIGTARCPRIVCVDHVVGIGRELLEAVRQVGGEGIVSKRRGSTYRGGESRDWFKAWVFDTGNFVITGFSELGEGRLEAVLSPRSAAANWCLPAKCGSALLGKVSGKCSTRCATARPGTASCRCGASYTHLSSISVAYKRGFIRDGVILLVRGLR